MRIHSFDHNSFMLLETQNSETFLRDNLFVGGQESRVAFFTKNSLEKTPIINQGIVRTDINAWKSVRRIYVIAHRLFSIIILVFVAVCSVVMHGTFAIFFLQECTHFLSVYIPIACGQISLNLPKKSCSRP